MHSTLPLLLPLIAGRFKALHSVRLGSLLDPPIKLLLLLLPVLEQPREGDGSNRPTPCNTSVCRVCWLDCQDEFLHEEALNECLKIAHRDSSGQPHCHVSLVMEIGTEVLSLDHCLLLEIMFLARNANPAAKVIVARQILLA